MANEMFGLGREKFLIADLDWDGNIKFQFARASGYTVSIDVDEFFDDVTGGGRVTNGLSANLSSKTSTLGTADAVDETVTSVTAGAAFDLIIFFQDSGVEATSPLFLKLDTAGGLPTTPNGSDITLVFDSGPDKIFTL